MNERILILCSDGAHHQYLVNSLKIHFNVVGVIIEPYKNQIKYKLSKRQYRNFLYMNYHELRRRWMGYTQYRFNYFKIVPEEIVSTKIPTLIVNNINTEKSRQFIRKCHSNIVVVMGTSVISKTMLDFLGDVIINIHGGYLPDYKGNHCFFFALYNRDYDKIGSTIHFIDSGVDTGDIIERVIPELTSKDNAETLYCKAEKKAIDRLVEILHAYVKGNPIPRQRQPSGGRTYRTRDRKIYHELFMLLKRNIILKEMKNYE